MALALLLLAVLAFVAYKVTTEAERARFAQYLQRQLQRWLVVAAEFFEAHQAFFDGLRARKRFAPVTSSLVLINTTMFVVVMAASLFTSRDTLVEWGASIGPRTTNGEWWRLVTSLFVQPGVLQLLAGLIGLAPLGLVLERLVGSMAVAVVYLAAGVFAGLATLFAYPMAPSAGASGAICGVYGLALATAARGVLQRPRVTVPWGVLKWLAGAAILFLACTVPSDIVPRPAEVTGFIVGAVCGLIMTRGVGTGLVPVRRTVAIGAAAVALALAIAVPLRAGIIDVRPGIDRMMATDERTAQAFRAAATQLTLGRTSEKKLIDLLEREIIPALESEQLRLAPHGVVPDDQKPLVAAADEYLRLRIESWRLRATAFRKGSLAMLRQADNKEGAARDVLARNPGLSPT